MTNDERRNPLVEYLESLARDVDRAQLAALRKSLRPDGRWEGLRIVLPFVADGPYRQQREDDALLLASLFALHPETGSSSLARAVRNVRSERGSESIEGRFVALLASEREDLDHHLRHAVTLVRSSARSPGIDWRRLHRDIRHWSTDWVRRQWARDFWGSAQATSSDAPNTETTTHPES